MTLKDVEPIVRALKIAASDYKKVGDPDKELLAMSIVEMLEDAPVVDAKPVVHATWLMSPDWYPYCSACGMFPEGDIEGCYCPYCGAKIGWRGGNR